MNTALALLMVAWASDGRAEILKVAAVFGTSVEEPWVERIHSALLRASGPPGILYRWSDDAAPDDVGPTLRHYAEQGYDLIVADSFSAEAPAREVALDFPQTAFLLGSGGGPTAPNVPVFDNWIHEPAYLAGMIAGKLTQRRRDAGLWSPGGHAARRRRDAGRRSPPGDLGERVSGDRR